MKRPNRKAVKVKRAAVVKHGVIVPEVVKVALLPDKVFHVEAPRDHIPVVAVHPVRNVVEVVAVPKKKKRTFMQWILGE